MLDLIFSDYRSFVQDALAFLLVVIAFVWGGGPERVVALTWLVFFELLSALNIALWGIDRSLNEIDLFLFTIDALALVIWMICALYANRNYVLWIAAMQLLAVTAHLARGLVEAISPVAYATMVFAPGWFQLLFFAVGLFRHIMRRREYGPYRDWRVSRKWPSVTSKSAKKWSLTRLLGHDFFPIKDER